MASPPSTHSQHPVDASVDDTILPPPSDSPSELPLPSIPSMGSSTLSATTPSSPSAIPHSHGLGVLPSRRSDAPFFDSNHPEDLEDFLLEVDALANTHGLEDEEKVYLAVRYADSRAKRIWKVADGEVLYNSSDKTRYNREFIPLLRKFKKKGFISDMEERHWFWKGIERGTRRRIAYRLSLLDKDWDGYSPPPVADVVKAGLLVLGARLENSEDDSEEEERPVRRSKRVVAEPSVSTVDLAAALLIGQTAALQSMLVVHLFYCTACYHSCSIRPSGPKSRLP